MEKYWEYLDWRNRAKSIGCEINNNGIEYGVGSIDIEFAVLNGEMIGKWDGKVGWIKYNAPAFQ